MKTVGGFMMAIGTLAAGASLLMKTSVATRVPSALGYGLTEASEVHNLGLLQTQSLIFTASCAIFVAGAVFLGCGFVVDAIAGRKQPSAPAITDALPVTHPRATNQQSLPEPLTVGFYWIGGVVIATVVVSLIVGILK